MADKNIIEIAFGTERIAYAPIQYRYNSGMTLKFSDIELPTSYQVHFSNSQTGNSIEQIGNANGVSIPDDVWNPGQTIYAWIYLHPTETSSVTTREARIPIASRATLPDGTEPTPQEQSTIDQLIAELNSAVEHYPKIIDNFWYVWDTTTQDYVNTNVSAIGVVDPLHFHINDNGELIMTIGEE